MTLTQIINCNETHPLNLLAADCLQGSGWESGSSLAILALIEAFWDVLRKSPILNQCGGPTTSTMKSLLASLTTIDPSLTMRYLTMTGGIPALNMHRLEMLDGVEIAHEVLQVIASQMMLGVDPRAP